MAGIKHILVTGGGAPGAYGIIEALKLNESYRISSCDIRNNAIGAELASEFFTVPSGKDPNYIDHLIKECKARSIDVIFPITTNELIPLSAAKPDFNTKGIEVVVSALNSLNIANSKCNLYAHLQQHNIAVPRFYLAKNSTEFEFALNQFETNEAIAFKPCIANGSRGFRIIDSKVDEYDLLFNHKPNSSYITKEKAMEVVTKGPFVPMLVSEYLEGDEYSVDCLIDNNQQQLIIPRKRLKINNGISVEGIFEKNKAIIEYCSEILNSLSFFGPIGIQVKIHHGKPLILEINPRIQGTSIACMGIDINIPQMAIELSNGALLSDYPEVNNIKWGTSFIRHYKELFRD